MTLIPKNLYGEDYTDEIAFLIKPKKVLGEVQSKFQKTTIIETEKFGKVIFQDGLIYVADTGNESIAEMYTHIPMLSGPVKKEVLLIGAGDGAGILRFLEYKDMSHITAIDIDKDFVDLAKKIMPNRTKSFDDERVTMLYVDGAEYMRTTEKVFDVMAVTVGDPFTISQTMFNDEFVKNAYDHLSENGILSMDGYMPFYTHDDSLNYWDIFEMISKVFPIVRIAISTSPLMPGGLCTFIFASKTIDMSKTPERIFEGKTQWYNKELHSASFVLPEFMREKLKDIKGFEQ